MQEHYFNLRLKIILISNSFLFQSVNIPPRFGFLRNKVNIEIKVLNYYQATRTRKTSELSNLEMWKMTWTFQFWPVSSTQLYLVPSYLRLANLTKYWNDENTIIDHLILYSSSHSGARFLSQPATANKYHLHDFACSVYPAATIILLPLCRRQLLYTGSSSAARQGIIEKLIADANGAGLAADTEHMALLDFSSKMLTLSFRRKEHGDLEDVAQPPPHCRRLRDVWAISPPLVWKGKLACLHFPHPI